MSRYIDTDAGTVEEYTEQYSTNVNKKEIKIGTPYWAITADKGIYLTEWDDVPTDRFWKSIGNMFRTKEDAEFALERLKVIAELRQYAEPFMDAWDTERLHFSLFYDLETHKIAYNRSYRFKRAQLTFETLERAEEAVAAAGEGRVKKYYLGADVRGSKEDD